MTEEITQRAARAVADFEHAAGFLKRPYFEAIVTQALRHSITAAHSPWLDRAEAAAHCRCSLSELDRAATMGFIKRFERGGTPLFSKTDLNTAIAAGRWRPHRTKEIRNSPSPLRSPAERGDVDKQGMAASVEQGTARKLVTRNSGRTMTKSEDRGDSRKDGN